MTAFLSLLRWFSGLLWSLSWFELYLEIVRFRHVRLPWSSLGSTAPAIRAGAHAGWWLHADLTCAVLAPTTFLVFAMLRRGQAPGASPTLSGDPTLAYRTLAVAGVGVAALGLINQLIWRPPLALDLTLRNGNGGFIVTGLACTAIGGWRAYHRAKQVPRA